MSEEIHIIGTGLTAFKEHWDKSLIDLICESVDEALNGSELSFNDLDLVVIGNMLAGETSQQSHLGSLVNSIYKSHTPAFRVEAACASGGFAVYQALANIKSGQTQTVLVIGAEKMKDHTNSKMTQLLAQASSQHERENGASFPGLYALLAQAHMQNYGTTREQLAAASVLAHQNAMRHPKAQFHKEISFEDVLNSIPIAEPLNLLDCSPTSDGAAALILSSDPKKITQSRKRKGSSIHIKGASCASDSIGLGGRETLLGLKATQIASEKLFQMTGLAAQDIDIAELHDCFSIAMLLAMEDIGFVKKGQSGPAIESILNKKDSHKNLPIFNPSGGLKAFGHAVGATGVKQIVTITESLRTESKSYGLTHNVGGSGGSCVMHLLEQKYN